MTAEGKDIQRRALNSYVAQLKGLRVLVVRIHERRG
jgi:hypothetical protein